MVVCAAHEGVLAGLSLLRAAVLLLALSTSMAADAGSWTRLYLLAGQNLRRIRRPHLDEGELAIARPRIARSWLPLWLPTTLPTVGDVLVEMEAKAPHASLGTGLTPSPHSMCLQNSRSTHSPLLASATQGLAASADQARMVHVAAKEAARHGPPRNAIAIAFRERLRKGVEGWVTTFAFFPEPAMLALAVGLSTRTGEQCSRGRVMAWQASVTAMMAKRCGGGLRRLARRGLAAPGAGDAEAAAGVARMAGAGAWRGRLVRRSESVHRWCSVRGRSGRGERAPV